jgi:hypothetical protein
MIRPDTDFPSSYAQARERFLEVARSRGGRIESFDCPAGVGLHGEALATDVAVFGPADARSVLMTTSGTHGVEGYCGSGVQHALLRDGTSIDEALSAGLRVVMVHALNPWGFSWCRRVTQENVDLNRNVRDFPAPDGPDPDYDEIHDLLLPATPPVPLLQDAALTAFIARRGEPHFRFAVGHGQWSRPDGMFFCGRAPTWSNTTLRTLLRRHVRGAGALFWIDYHTGLGPSGHGELIYNGRDATADVARTRGVWGPSVTSIFDGSSVSAAISGWIGNAAYEECPDTAFAAVALEYGTAPFDQVLDAMREDQWSALRAPADAPARARARQRMVDAFFTDTEDWKATVRHQGFDTFAKAVAAARAA